ncbi:MAG: hypothetical protein LPJ96_01620 [Exiguobacterium sp.]|uniref:DUF1659 domain-containing protein n=1 Tax=Exiguobacterium alkaliphilum TaxID=1428684 RepID=A0ABT2KYX8_9BACL|nr:MULTISPECIES: hypothetical protein [Exiguobacterium]MDX5322290.1 hypothetical protein [Exiguobacterium sp.]KDN58102.1 hypothetical protein DI14_13285 [Exiguobacterium sp. AB2]MCT4794760.1 hypothetical protein [Exiguobacterium alkaliphilum]MDX5424007.1 hypothetical protein [Exiguobacterium sp.]MDX6771537.1 hypothetical protein [Exiguobacterium sp.]
MAIYREYASIFYLDTKRVVDGKDKRQLVRFGPLGARMETAEIKQFGDLVTRLLSVDSATYVVSREFHVTV